MSSMIAKPVIKNKFWIVENDGQKVGTIQALDDGVVLVRGNLSEKFASFKLLSSKHNIVSTKNTKAKKVDPNQVHDYPCDSFPYNPIFDLKLRLPLFTKEPKSKSYYCAGHYLINIEGEWSTVFCPKKIVLSRNDFFGPYASQKEADGKLSLLL